MSSFRQSDYMMSLHEIEKRLPDIQAVLVETKLFGTYKGKQTTYSYFYLPVNKAVFLAVINQLIAQGEYEIYAKIEEDKLIILSEINRRNL